MRRWLAVVSLLMIVGICFNAQGQSLKDPLGVQLWSFRVDFKKDVPGTLKRIRALGFTEVELAGYYGLGAEGLKKELDKAGLKAVSMHIDLRTARDKTEQTIKEAKILGVKYVGVPYLKSPFTRKDCDEAISVFNQAGRRFAEAGLVFFYHPHGYEFVPGPEGKGTLFDYLMEKTDAKYVKMQLDTFHVAFPGQDPVAILKKFPGRFVSIHLKDIGKEVKGNDSGDAPEKDMRPIGEGRINWAGLLAEARKQGIHSLIIEDESATPWDGVPKSLAYLKGLKY